MPITFDAQIDFDVDGNFAGPPSGNQVTNGDFASGETGWKFLDGIVHSVSGGKLHAYRNGGTIARFYQDFDYRACSGDTFLISVKIANTSAANNDITVYIHSDADFTGAFIA